MTRQILISKEELWFVATDIQTNVASQGKTLEEATENLKEALELYFDDESAIPSYSCYPVMLSTLEVFS